ncbi:MAG TPA: ABC transporter permease subunit [Chitinophagales bacterium]|nr:ABC transporter permease subunit [Chitinophagales bacterium]
MQKIIKYVVIDIMRNRIMIAYTILLLLISASVFNLEDNPEKGLLSLLYVILIIVPLISIVFSTIYIYNAAEFIELLLAQPVRRTALLMSIFSGLCFSLVLSFLIGVGIPVLVFSISETGIMLLLTGVALTAIFVSLALLASVITRDKARGIGVAIMLWFYFALIYDGLLLFFLFQFSDYPLEKPMIILSSLNPIDLGRILILLKLDVAALLGYTGAVFRQFLGNSFGIIYSVFIMMLWIIIPFGLALRKFSRKDL